MSSKNPGKVYLIPNYLSEGQEAGFIPKSVHEVIQNLDYFLVENIRTSRRFISSLKLDIEIAKLRFEVMDKRFNESQLPKIFEPVLAGQDIGIQSEAGLPGIADPGKLAVAYAHQKGIRVVTLPGASSIILGLIASGFNGQQFTFHGYLPIDKSARIKALRELEAVSEKTGYTQVFMETPYRNNELLALMIKQLKPTTHLFIGKDLTGAMEFTQSKPLQAWKKTKLDLHKVPVIFAIGN